MTERILKIARAGTCKARLWTNEEVTWSQLVARCASVRRCDHTAAEYAAATRATRARLKDGEGFVGGYLRDGVRHADHVECRSLLTLDLDHGATEALATLRDLYTGVSWLVYSTHSHTEAAPRLRVIMPLSRDVSTDEYEPVARRVAADIGITAVDAASYRVAQLMYLPSAPADAPVVFVSNPGAALDVDAQLRRYVDPFDVSAWPRAPQEEVVIRRDCRAQGDPADKPGVVGAFCSCYSITEAMDTFLPGVYATTGRSDRRTYTGGSGFGGCVIYDDKYMYSHHDTDPAGKQCVNAFDMVRLHRYGREDTDPAGYDRVTSRPSYKAMTDLAAADPRVKSAMVARHVGPRLSAEADFADLDTEGAAAAAAPWMADLDTSRTGVIKSTAANIVTILNNDTRLRGKLWYNEFSGEVVAEPGLPWATEGGKWTNADDARLRVYLERRYNVSSNAKVSDAFVEVTQSNRRHPVREYFDSLRWDGVKRLETLFIDLLGAEDSKYVRAASVLPFVAAVRRVYRPGAKFDICLVLQGPEGCGKSTVFEVMGGPWFIDSITTFDGKAAMEQIQGSLIVELSELTAMDKVTTERVKQFLSSSCDKYRGAYQARVEEHPRQCVFVGSTNQEYFLRSETGDRRFNPVRVEPSRSKFTNTADRRRWLEDNRDQLWAEAVDLHRRGMKLYLRPDIEAEAVRAQRGANVDNLDPMAGQLEGYLDTPVPTDWESRSLMSRRNYYRADRYEVPGSATRDTVAPVEFMCECLGIDPGDTQRLRATARNVRRYLRELGWTEGKMLTLSIYGRQNVFNRPANQVEAREAEADERREQLL